jgi:hypothetical protein
MFIYIAVALDGCRGADFLFGEADSEVAARQD